MKKGTLPKSLLAVAGIIVATVVIWQLTKTFTSAEPLSEKDATRLVEKMYSGENTEVSREDDVYKIKFEIESGIYEIDVNRKTGDVTNLTQISQEPQEKTEAEVRDILAKEKAGEIKTIEKKNEQDKAYYYATVTKGETEATYKLETTTGKIVDVVENKQQTQTPPETTPNTQEPPTKTAQRISEQQAIELALKVVNGVVDDVELEEEAGQPYYFIEIEDAGEEEFTVQVHAISGEVKAIVSED
ncbi:PepSY domain-containing protein [Fredinandcohnia salidurans]|uniref:PepSY domain-containing protein n=1 Tax=Fredinandcohnia salidurans TaxID=2595041 RepID=A0ABW4ML07_9BACI